MLRTVFRIAAILWFGCLFVCGFLAYFVTYPDGDVLRDGLGRQLSLAPTIVRVVFRTERMWAGGGWFLVELAIFWGSVYLAQAAYKGVERITERRNAAATELDAELSDQRAVLQSELSCPSCGHSEVDAKYTSMLCGSDSEGNPVVGSTYSVQCAMCSFAGDVCVETKLPLPSDLGYRE